MAIIMNVVGEKGKSECKAPRRSPVRTGKAKRMEGKKLTGEESGPLGICLSVYIDLDPPRRRL